MHEEKAVKRFARQVMMLELDPSAAEEASKIMGALLRLGKPINAMDVLISGIAVSNNAESIVTFDRDFEHVGKIADIDIRLL